MVLCWPSTADMTPTLKCGQYTQWDLLEKTKFSFANGCQLGTASSLASGSPCPFPLWILRPIWHEPLQVQHMLPQKILFPYSHPTHLALTNLSTSSSAELPNPWAGVGRQTHLMMKEKTLGSWFPLSAYKMSINKIRERRQMSEKLNNNIFKWSQRPGKSFSDKNISKILKPKYRAT